MSLNTVSTTSAQLYIHCTYYLISLGSLTNLGFSLRVTTNKLQSHNKPTRFSAIPSHSRITDRRVHTLRRLVEQICGRVIFDPLQNRLERQQTCPPLGLPASARSCSSPPSSHSSTPSPSLNSNPSTASRRPVSMPTILHSRGALRPTSNKVPARQPA